MVVADFSVVEALSVELVKASLVAGEAVTVCEPAVVAVDGVVMF